MPSVPAPEIKRKRRPGCRGGWFFTQQVQGSQGSSLGCSKQPVNECSASLHSGWKPHSTAFRGPMWCWGGNLGQLQARSAPPALTRHSGEPLGTSISQVLNKSCSQVLQGFLPPIPEALGPPLTLMSAPQKGAWQCLQLRLLSGHSYPACCSLSHKRTRPLHAGHSVSMNGQWPSWPL